MLTIIIIIALLEAVIIYGMLASDRFYTMCKDMLGAVKKALRKKPKEN